MDEEADEPRDDVDLRERGATPDGRGPTRLQTSARGDRERDRAALEREYAHEESRRAQGSGGQRLVRYRRLAELHRHAAGLLEELATVYDELDAGQ